MSEQTGSVPSCPYCGGWPHDFVGTCPRVKVIEFYTDGTIKRVEKFEPQPALSGTWPFAASMQGDKP